MISRTDLKLEQLKQNLISDLIVYITSRLGIISIFFNEKLTVERIQLARNTIAKIKEKKIMMS